MENSSYSSKSDSLDVENDVPPTANYKVKFLCSYGGKIQPRPHDKRLTYVAGDTKILTVDRYVKFNNLLTKLSAMSGGDVYFKYQLPGEDLDALISVTNDEDLDHMMVEYDRLYKSSAKPARLRLFLFSLKPAGTNSSFGSSESKSGRQWFVESLSEQPVTLVAADTTPDYLFGLEEITKQSHSEEVLAQAPEIHRQLEEIQKLQISNSAQDQTSRYYKGEYGNNNEHQQQTAFEVKSHAGGYWAEQHLPPGGPYAHPPLPLQTEQPVYAIQTPTTGMYEPVRQGYYGMETMGFIRGPARVAVDGAGRQVYYAAQGGVGMAPPVQGVPPAATTVFMPPNQGVGGPGYVPQVAFPGKVSQPPTM